MFLRRVDLFDKYPAVLEESADFKRFNQELRERTKIIMNLLSERQRDALLEQHRIKPLARAEKKIQLA
jgi:hypothetical protein